MYGNFIKNTAGYEINSLDMKTSWEYIYENKDILLKVDQYGPVYAQANPPGDIMLFKREQHQKYSSWQFNIAVGDSSFSNFPKAADNPKNLKIRFRPESATYYFEKNGLACETELFVPSKGTTVVYKVKLKNISGAKKAVTARSGLVPYLNDAVIAPWDKYDWYLDTSRDKNRFVTKLLSAEADSAKRRCAELFFTEDSLEAHEISLDKFVGSGDINAPEYNFTDDERIYGYSPIYALLYRCALEAEEEKEFVQILTLGDENAEKYFDEEYYGESLKKRRGEFEALFSKNRISTSDADFDYYVNYWLPLQMNWVASLDRGWPTGMRGSRDSAQDYTALLYTDTEAAEKIIMTMLECQRTDGWFPRQYSAKGKHGKHDLRTHSDGGAFFIEFIWKYMAHTHSLEILNRKTQWLDSDEESTVFDHVMRAVEYYISDENIGEHGLCKIRGGDWLDAVNAAGLEGRGESVTVSEQTVMSLKYIADILNHIGRESDSPKYLSRAEELKQAVNKHAYNASGYYNGVYNDDGKWIFSDNDPDGEKRIYGVSNYYAVISGVADGEKTASVLKNAEMLKSDKGYRLFYPYLGEKPIAKVGRIASGDVPPYLGENGNVYNHGSQGFFARALSVSGNGEKLNDVLKWLMPYDTSKHPTDKTFTPPYAIVNCWQQLPEFDHRGLMCFLTGSVAMAMRGVYEWTVGICPCLDGIEFIPCVAETLGEAEVRFEYCGRAYNMKITADGRAFVNGHEISGKRKNIITDREVYFASFDELQRM